MRDPFDSIMDELGDPHNLDDGRSIVERDVSNGMVDFVHPAVPESGRGYRDPLLAEFDRLREAAQRSGVSDELYQHIEAQLARSKDAYRDVRFVGTPPSAAGKVLGNNAVLTSDLVIATKPCARWQADHDAENLPVTVVCGPVTPLAVNGASAIRPFFYVRWGVYGQNFTAEVDAGTGRQFTVNASMIEVDAALEALTTANAQQANLSAYLSFRAPLRTSPLIRTRYIDSLAQGAGNAQNIVVPPFAVALLPIQMSDSTTPGVIQLDFRDTSNTIRYSLSIPNGSQIAPIPLAGDIVRVTVTNSSATAQHVRLPFELSI